MTGWEWEEAAFEEARRRNLPVLLSVGYAACHWCHVMAHESFEDEATTAYLNKHFVSIKIDCADFLLRELREALGDEDGAWAAEVFTVTEAGTYDPPALEPGDQPI